jgi:potassium-transporting ATPase KdpC subunit
MWRQLAPAFRMVIFMTVLTGFVYPGVVTGICQLVFPRQANGSMISADGRTVGSGLIGQRFSKPEYFHPRPSAAGNGYDASSSSGTNYGPTNRKLIDRVKASLVQFHKNNPGYKGPVPADAVTASGSGLDPDISPAFAEAQAARIARVRGVRVAEVDHVIHEHTQGRLCGFLGEPRVNVLEINLALDQQFPQR